MLSYAVITFEFVVLQLKILLDILQAIYRLFVLREEKSVVGEKVLVSKLIYKKKICRGNVNDSISKFDFLQ